jgi:tRNA(Ile)-lysidine synthase TilS/MesJ
MRENNHICQKCILPDSFLGINLDDNGLCDFCRDPTYENPNWSKIQITEELKSKAIQDWNDALEKLCIRDSKRDYDCILGYSGGKDSTALLDLLINKYDLKVLAITVYTGHMSRVAKENINKTLKTLDYAKHHLFFEDAISTFNKLYKHLFLSHSSNKNILTGKVCDLCSDLIHSILVKEAIKRKIPYIILGYSPDQIKRYFYEISEDEIKQNWYPEFINKKPFSENDRSFFINPSKIRGKKIPRILLAYHVLPYKEEKIIKEVNSKNLIEKGKTDPVITNCNVVKAGLMYDFYRFGWLSYALQYAELIRQESNEKKHRNLRKKWLRICISIAKLIINGKFAKNEIDQFLKKIGLSKETLLNRIERQLEDDPNKNQIIKNINFYKS